MTDPRNLEDLIAVSPRRDAAPVGELRLYIPSSLGMTGVQVEVRSVCFLASHHVPVLRGWGSVQGGRHQQSRFWRAVVLGHNL